MKHQNVISTARLARLRAQGFFTQTNKELGEAAFGIRFPARTCLVILAIGIATASIPVLSVMLAIALMGAITHNHPFDYLFNSMIAKPLGKPKIPARDVRGRFACGFASVNIAITIALFAMGYTSAAYVSGIMLVSAVSLVAFTDFCIPSFIYNKFSKLPSVFPVKVDESKTENSAAMRAAVIAIVLMTGLGASAQDMINTPERRGAGFAGHVMQVGQDFGIGLQFISPTNSKTKTAFSLRANHLWLEHLLGNEMTWTSYASFQPGFVQTVGYIGENIRVYGEGGSIFILPSEEFSTSSIEFGGYGLFGFEFQFDPCMSYYIEIGGSGTSARADKLELMPVYANGMQINVGFRFRFK